MRFFLAMILTLFTVTANAKLLNSPFDPHDDRRFDNIEQMTGDVTLTFNGFNQNKKNALTSAIGAGKITEAQVKALGADGLNVLRVAKATWDTSVGTQAQIGAHSLGISLPTNAIIKQSYIYVVTQAATSASGTLALSCQNANNIFSAADVTGSSAGAMVAGVSVGTAATMKPLTAACAITATVATGLFTAGKFDVYVEYVVHD